MKVHLVDGTYELFRQHFGNAARHLLDPLRVPADRRHPWAVDPAPDAAASAYARECDSVLGVEPVSYTHLTLPTSYPV